MIDEIIKYFKKNPADLTILILCIAILIIGSITVGIVISILIVGSILIVLIGLPYLYQFIKKPKRKEHRKMEEKPIINNYNYEQKVSTPTHEHNTIEASRSSYKKVNHKPKKNRSNKSKKKTILKWILIVILVMFIACFVGLAIFFGYIVLSAPAFDPDNLYQQQSSIIYDNKGKVLTTLGVEKREVVSYDELPEVLVNAIVATEDARFFQHNGFDLPRFSVATVKQLLGNSNAGGGSTLTMQVSKNHFTSREASGIKGIIRKFTDIYMSIFVIEKKYTKEEILEFYVNSAFLGSNSYGVEQACQTYFGKSVKDINLAEAALIAGLFQAPSSYDLYYHPEAAEERRQTVLYLMQRHGYINEEQKQLASKITAKDLLTTTKTTNKYQSFIDAVIDDVIDTTKQNPYNVPMQIYSTMDRSKQDDINNVMNGKTYTWENKVVQAGIAVIDNKTGYVLALGSGRGTSDKERTFNYATQSKRQIGSTAKPLYDYGPGIEYNNWSTYEPFVDEPYKYSSGTTINNWDMGYEGFLTMREALAGSRNIPALKAFQRVKNSKILDFVTKLGLSPEVQNGIVHEAHSIGAYTGESPLTLAAAYSAFPAGGYYTKPHTFSKIVYRDNDDVYEVKEAKTKVMSPETAYMITDMLITTSTEALGYYSNIGSNITYGAKTGTTTFDSSAFDTYNLPSTAINDLWVVGCSPNYTISVWYGYDKVNSRYVSLFGNNSHKAIFQKVASKIFETGTKFTKPSGVVAVKLEKYNPTPVLASKYTPKSMITTELFKKGTEPTEVSTTFSKPNDVSNLNSQITGTTLKLTWNAVTNNPVDKSSLASQYKGLFSNTSYLNRFINNRISYNKSSVGSLGYNVYMKSNGNLSLLGFTTKNSYNVDLTGLSGNITFVVKTTFSKFTSNSSDGVELTVDVGDQTVTPVTVSLNGEDSVEVLVGEQFIDQDPPVIVLDNSVDVTSQATITTEIKNTASDVIVDSIDTSTPGEYTIIYTVTYNGSTEVITRYVTVKEA